MQRVFQEGFWCFWCECSGRFLHLCLLQGFLVGGREDDKRSRKSQGRMIQREHNDVVRTTMRESRFKAGQLQAKRPFRKQEALLCLPLILICVQEQPRPTFFGPEVLIFKCCNSTLAKVILWIASSPKLRVLSSTRSNAPRLSSRVNTWRSNMDPRKFDLSWFGQRDRRSRACNIG